MIESLARMQIPFEASEILSSGDLFAPFAQKMGIREAFYIGRPNGAHFVEKGGVRISENPSENTVIVSATGKEEHLFEDALKILRRPGAKMIVLNPDAWAPRISTPREGVSGCYAHRLYLEAHPETFYFGKPFKSLFDKAIASLPRKMKTVMIGDTLATDIGGAMNAGIDAALIIGRNQPASELSADEKFLKIRPTYYLDKL
jgi:ribonucleotide monophosphatase NagD (HAD superfamily)